MHILIATDAWHPQINGVVRVLDTLRTRLMDKGFEVTVISPGDFMTLPCPGYAEIPLALFPQRKMRSMLKRLRPDVIHIATEGPIGWAMRKICLKNICPSPRPITPSSRNMSMNVSPFRWIACMG